MGEREVGGEREREEEEDTSRNRDRLREGDREK